MKEIILTVLNQEGAKAPYKPGKENGEDNFFHIVLVLS